jgi:hypothetical protein
LAPSGLFASAQALRILSTLYLIMKHAKSTGCVAAKTLDLAVLQRAYRQWLGQTVDDVELHRIVPLLLSYRVLGTLEPNHKVQLVGEVPFQPRR